MHNNDVPWKVLVQQEFLREIERLPEPLQDEIFAHALVLERFGPSLGRPWVDTLKGSRHPGMKELRFGWQRQSWRVAFAFDPERRAILLAGGGKRGADQARFYRRLIVLADRRFDGHLAARNTPQKGKRKR